MTAPVELGGRFPDLSFLDLKFLYDLGEVDIHWDNAAPTDFQAGLESWFFSPEHYHSKCHRYESRRHEEYPAVQGPVKGNNVRHHRRALISNNVIGFPNGCMVLGGLRVWSSGVGSDVPELWSAIGVGSASRTGFP